MILGSLDYKKLERELATLEGELRRATAPKKVEELSRARRTRKQEIEEPRRMYKGGLARLLKLQRKDFEGIFKAMDGLPVTIRTLDPPLHEFLPHDEIETRKLARKFKVKPQHLWERVQSLHEANRCSASAAAAWESFFRDNRDAGARDLRSRGPRSDEGRERCCPKS